LQVTALRYFDAVARLGSIRQAAEFMHVASSAISRQINKLEDELGSSLFERHARGVRLTEAGHLFAAYAHEALLKLEGVQSDLDALKGLQRGHITVNIVEGILSDFILHVMTGFHAQFPGVTYGVTIGGTDKVVDAVAEDRAHIGLVYNFNHHTSIKKEESLRQPPLAVMEPQHVLAKKKRLALAEVCTYPVAFPAETFGIRRLLDETLYRMGQKITPTLVTNSIDALKSFAREGMGITFLPRFTLMQELEANTLVTVPLTPANFGRSRVEVITRKNRVLPIAAEAMLKEIKLLFQRWE
jgi:DNA-binding transcriptional LysR family regulator